MKLMTKEMLFLCDVYTNWCDSQNLPNFYSADDLCYGRDTKDKLTLKQKNWLESSRLPFSWLDTLAVD